MFSSKDAHNRFLYQITSLGAGQTWKKQFDVTYESTAKSNTILGYLEIFVSTDCNTGGT